MKPKFNKNFFLISILTFVVGIVLFFFSSGFIRNYIGDVVVVIFLYSLLSTFFKIRIQIKAAAIFLLAVFVELAQLFIQMPTNQIASITLGSSFDKFDIIAYIIGLIIITLYELISKRKERK